MSNRKELLIKTISEASSRHPEKEITELNEEELEDLLVELKLAVDDPFSSMCGQPFDPANKSECLTVCAKDNLEDFKACQEHYKTQPVKPVIQKAESRGKSHWGHINATQAGLIDDAVVGATKLLSLDEIAEMASAKPARTLHHLKHLVANKGAGIMITEKGGIFWEGNKKVRVKSKHDSISNHTLRKPAAVKAPEKEKEAEKETAAKGVVEKKTAKA